MKVLFWWIGCVKLTNYNLWMIMAIYAILIAYKFDWAHYLIYIISGNHKTIFKKSGYSDVREYRYWHAETKSLDFNGMCEDLNVNILTFKKKIF
jgi:hypothetical protein